MRIGINSVVTLSQLLNPKSQAIGKNKKQAMAVEKLNLADNSVSDFGMHAIKTILKNNNL